MLTPYALYLMISLTPYGSSKGFKFFINIIVFFIDIVIRLRGQVFI